ncbi:hypothetical protein ACOSQ3_027501 [Xanthoceras sorbifolium]
MVIRGFASHTVVVTSILNMYAKLGRIEDSYKVFNTMTEHTEVSWNAIISGFTFNGQLGDVDKGKEVESLASELGMESNVQLGTALIDMYSKCGSLNNARAVFDSNFTDCGVNMPWNAMISGYSQKKCSREALELYVRMCQNDIKSDVYTYCSVFNAIASLKYLQFGNQVHGMLLKSRADMLVISVYNAIADAYAKCGALVDVRKIFDRMEERNIVFWTTLVTAHC